MAEDFFLDATFEELSCIRVWTGNASSAYWFIYYSPRLSPGVHWKLFFLQSERHKVGRVSSEKNQKLLGMKIDMHTHTPWQLEYSSVPNKVEAFPPLALKSKWSGELPEWHKQRCSLQHDGSRSLKQREVKNALFLVKIKPNELLRDHSYSIFEKKQL